MQKHTISFKNAFAGIWAATTTQFNIRIHLLIGSIVMILGVYLKLSLDHIIDLLLLIALVISTEMINTSIEFTCNAITKEKHPIIKIAKDVSAGAVLFMAIFAALIGIVIFIPPIMSLISNF